VGQVTFPEHSVDPAARAIKLKGTFDNGHGKLWPGQFVNGLVKLSDLANSAVIPPEAGLVGQNGEYVFVVKPDSRVEQRPISVSLRAPKFIAIEKGVALGESVV